MAKYTITEKGYEYQCTCGKPVTLKICDGRKPERLIKCFDCLGGEIEKKYTLKEWLER